MRQHYQIQKSKLLASMIIVIHAGPLVLLFYLDIPWWNQILLSSWFLINLFFCNQRYISLKAAKSIVEFWQNDNGTWQLGNGNQENFPATLSGSSTVTNLVIILNFNLIENNQAEPTKPKMFKLLRKILNCNLEHSLIIFRDALTPDEFRKLKVATSDTAAT